MKFLLTFSILLLAVPINASENVMHGTISGVESNGVKVYIRAVDGKDIAGIERVYHAKTSSFLKIGTRHITFLCVTDEYSPSKVYGYATIDVTNRGDKFFLRGRISSDGERCLADVEKMSRVDKS